ncbi:tRNA (guanine-N(1)-)-methyltransferase [Clostridium sp. CAG:1219]|nr:tRNA (guanine-N(1)-)-methyltransferase [Clostridium sp. CAG:1219]
MIKFIILSLFPEMFNEFINASVIGRAVKKGLVQIKVINFREFSEDKHRRVDFPPYGGGSGMVISPLPLMRAIEYSKEILKGEKKIKIIYLSPRGRLLNYELSKSIAESNCNYILICGHYEGIDERIIEKYNVEEISIGDYVLTGGELASQVLCDSIIRLIPGAIDEGSLVEESHTNNLLEYPQYTKPDNFCGMVVPEILKSGNHEKIKEYRKQESIRITKKYRPDLLNNK